MTITTVEFDIYFTRPALYLVNHDNGLAIKLTNTVGGASSLFGPRITDTITIDINEGNATKTTLHDVQHTLPDTPIFEAQPFDLFETDDNEFLLGHCKNLPAHSYDIVHTPTETAYRIHYAFHPINTSADSLLDIPEHDNAIIAHNHTTDHQRPIDYDKFREKTEHNPDYTYALKLK